MDINANRRLFAATAWAASLLMTAAILIQDARADSKIFTATNPEWKAECGSCHVAYPAQLLPAPAWRGIMSGLDKHFGADASLDAASAAGIGAFLEKNAGSGRRVRGARTLRVTETPWFIREHDEVPAAVWTNPAVKSPANCAACHIAAESGDFRERNIRVPR